MYNLILTINDDNNYGNRLQNYALAQVLSDYGGASTIRTHLGEAAGLDAAGRRRLERGRSLEALRGGRVSALKELRRRRMRAFTRRFAPDDRAELDARGGLSLAPGTRFDHVVIGSDQVWNCSWLGPDDLRVRLGMPVEAGRLVAYAASIGVDSVDPSWWGILREGWLRIPSISVREHRAAEIIREVSGREAQVVLDPVLLLDPGRWAGLAPERRPRRPYALAYFLGAPGEAAERDIRLHEAATGERVVRVNDPRRPLRYLTGPARLVGLFSGASHVFTDSYHGCCLSITFGVDFKAYPREGAGVDMSSRMHTLARLLGTGDLLAPSDGFPERDWAAVGRALEARRRESRAWLEAALGVEGVARDGH